MAEAGFDAGLSVLGYTNQAQFLINCGIGELLQKVGTPRALSRDGLKPAGRAGETVTKANLRAQGAVNMLLSPNEMGELFKVIALGRGMPQPLLGFTRGDRVHAL
nr:L334 [uncultured bacterium]